MAAAAAAGLGPLGGRAGDLHWFGVGLLYKTLNIALKGWKDIPKRFFGAPFKRRPRSESKQSRPNSSAWVISSCPRIGSIMCAGGVLAYLVLIPMIKFFGESLARPARPGDEADQRDGPDEIRGAYVLYIGAGAVAAPTGEGDSVERLLLYASLPPMTTFPRCLWRRRDSGSIR